MNNIEFRNIYAENKEHVWKLVSRYVRTQQDKEDLFQEVFLKVYKALPKFRGDSEVSTWIYRVAVNTSINYLKSRKRFEAFREIFGRFKVVHEDPEDQSEADDLLKPLEKLNPKQRMIIILSDVEEKKMEEIAKMMDMPVGTIKSNLHRAREILKKEVMKNDKL